MTKISALTSVGDGLAVGDQFIIRDIDDAGTPNKSVTISGITRALQDGTVAAPALAFANDKNTGIYRPGDDQLAISTNGTGRLFIDANGNAGLGTSNPANFAGFVTLALANSSGAEVDFIKGSTVQSSLYNASDIFYIESKSTIPTVFVTNGTERARIDSSGRLLVGTSTTGSALPGQADQKFQVAGGTDGGIVMSTFSADPYASNLEFRKSRSASIGTKTIVQSGDTLGKFYYCGADGTNFIPAAAIEAFVDGTPGANDMPGRLVFSTTADGSASPTERLRITSTGQVRLAGAGITFNGDTAAANELDDYEEGTFTPSVGGNATYTSRSGAYTKIGRKVSVVGQIVINTIGTGSATTVSDLPFASSVLAPVYVGIFQNLAINVVFLLGTIPASTSRIDFTSIATAGGTAPNDASVIGSGTRIDFAATYFI